MSLCLDWVTPRHGLDSTRPGVFTYVRLNPRLDRAWRCCCCRAPMSRLDLIRPGVVVVVVATALVIVHVAQ